MTGRIVHLLRHGPPVTAGLLLGHRDDPPLRADCPQMARRIAGLRLSGIVSSDLRRSAQQAASFASRHELPLSLDPRWRELDFGVWDGQPPEIVDKAAMARFWADPDAEPPPQGERWSALCGRVRAALEDAADRSLVVTHAGAMRAALSVLTGLDHRGVWAIDLPYRALLTMRVWPGEAIAGQVVGLDTGLGTGAGS